MDPVKISNTEARNIILSNQLLIKKNLGNTSNDLLDIIEKLGYIQIDTISVVERSHHHILWSRMNKYKKEMLDELVAAKKIFEYWSHAAAYLPMKEFRFTLIRKNNYSKRYKDWASANKKIIKYVYDRILSEGALQSRNFEDNIKGSPGWWDWKPSKDALDYLFHKGVLMIKSRKGFQKVYDLSDRILPEDTDTSFPSEKEYYENLILSSVNASGIATSGEITYQRRFDRNIFNTTLNELTEENKIQKIHIKTSGDSKEIYFTTKNKLDLISDLTLNSDVHIFSPFDNLIIQRKRIKTIFEFDYTIECYVPEKKRVFGYFCLPVLYGNKFAGRIDCKSDRKSDTFKIKNIYYENNFRKNKLFFERFEKKIIQFADFTGCSKIETY